MPRGPQFLVARSAYPYIHEVSFDADLFTNYLTERAVPEAEINALQLTIDDAYMVLGLYGAYIPRDSSDADSLHTIALSPRRMPVDAHRQGKLLRHETEHFIYHTKHPNHLRNRDVFVAGTTVTGACLGAAQGIRLGVELANQLPLAAEISIGTVCGIGATAIGAFVTLMPATIGHMAFGPSELQAEWAEYRRKSELPDGVLQITFA